MDLKVIEGKRFLSLTWPDVESLVERLADEISKSFIPDTLIGIIRGGMTVACLLSDFLGIHEVYAMGCRSYVGIEEKGSVIIYQPLSMELNGRRALLVDDVVDTGDTLRYALQYLRGLRPDTVKTATLHVKPHASFFPDFYADVVNAWIVYPWELNEFVKVMSSSMLPRLGFSRTLEELRKVVWKDSIIMRGLSGKGIESREPERV